MSIANNTDPDLQGLTDEDLEGLSEEERAAILAGDEPPGQDDPDDKGDPDDGDGEGDEGEATQPQEQAQTQDAPADNEGDEPTEKPSVAASAQPLTPDNAKDRRAELRKQRSDAQRKVFEGIMEPDEFDKIEGEIQDELDALVRSEAVDQTRHQIAIERMTDEYNAEVRLYQKAAKEAGLDISQGDLKPEFDRLVALCAQDAAARGLSDTPGNLAASKAGLRDAMLLLQGRHGKTITLPGAKQAPAAQKQEKARPKVDDRSKIPPSLANVPAAAEAKIDADEFSHLEGMDIADQERAVARMTPEQQERWANQ